MTQLQAIAKRFRIPSIVIGYFGKMLSEMMVFFLPFYFLHNYCEIFHLYTTILHEKHTKNKHYRLFDVKK